MHGYTKTSVKQDGICYLVADDTVKLLIGKGAGEEVSLDNLHIGQVSRLLF